MNSKYISICLFSTLFISCETGISVYQGDWVVVDYQSKTNRNATIVFANMSLNVRERTASLPVFATDDSTIFPLSSKIRFMNDGGNHFLEVTDHPLMTSMFSIKCMDVECCKIALSSQEHYMELCYNSDLDGITRSRSCSYDFEAVAPALIRAN